MGIRTLLLILVPLAFSLVFDNPTQPPATLVSFNDSICRFYVFPRVVTDSVPGDSDDAAIWIHPTDPSKNAIVGNDKVPNGALYVWDLNTGAQIFKSKPTNRAINIDIRYDFPLVHEAPTEPSVTLVDLVVSGIRASSELLVLRIDPETRVLHELGRVATGMDDLYGLTLFEASDPYRLYAAVSSKSNVPHPLKMFMLTPDGHGGVEGHEARHWGNADVKDLVEGMCSDEDTGYLYVSDEGHAVLKYHADPALQNDTLVASFGLDGFAVGGDREGIALYRHNERGWRRRHRSPSTAYARRLSPFVPNWRTSAGPEATPARAKMERRRHARVVKDAPGFLVVSNQRANSVNLYTRAAPNTQVADILTVDSTQTDGIAVTSHYLGSKFPLGALVSHNAHGRNFVLYDWRDIEIGLRQCARTEHSLRKAAKKDGRRAKKGNHKASKRT